MNNRWSCNLARPLHRLTSVFPVAIALAALAAEARASAPDWLRSAAQATLPKYPAETNAVVLLDDQSTTVTEAGEMRTLYRRAYRILRAEGRDRGLLAVFFDNETRLTQLKAWSIPAAGRDYEVKEKDAIETSAFNFALYQDTRTKLLKIPAAEPGNVIGYEYEQRRRPLGLQDAWHFQHDIPVRRSRFTLRLPQGWEYKAHWLNYRAFEPRAAGENQWVWEMEDLAAIEPEQSMPAWPAVAGWMGVTFYPRRAGSAQAGSTWAEVGSWYARLAGGRRAADAGIRQKVAELTAGAATTLDKIAKLSAFVQKEIRYVAIEIGIGGYQPHAAHDVLANRYGDCKDKATLLGAMLNEIGVRADYVLINTDRGMIVPEFPSALGFNHVILAIRLPADVPMQRLLAAQPDPPGTVLYFDPTSTLVPLGYLPDSLQANYGLVAWESGGELRKLPMLAPGANRLLRSAKLTLTPVGGLQGAVVEIRSGALAAELRARLLGVSEADRRKRLEGFLASFVGSSALRGTQVENLDDPAMDLVIHYGFTATDYAKAAGDLLLVRPRVLGHKGEGVLEEAGKKERKYPVDFPYTSSQGDIVEITLPDGYKVDELPPPVDTDTGIAEYHSHCEVNGNVLRYTRRYVLKDVRVPLERVSELKKFYSQVAADERNSAVLKRSAQ